MPADSNGQVDGRRVRGDRTRRAAVERAAQIASESGLSGVSFHQIATELGISKSGVAAAFGTKEELEVATVAAASATFMEHVVQPAMSKQAGRPRLKALIDSWFQYADDRVFAGGCFMVAVMPEYDTQPGQVRDALLRTEAAWRELLAEQVALMQERGQLDTKLSPDAVAFEITALLAAAVLEMNLSDQSSALAMARRVLRVRLGL
jgi:AcrR family transcriptional regulator